MNDCGKSKIVLNAQQMHWERLYGEEPDFFGEEPAIPQKRLQRFSKLMVSARFLSWGLGKVEMLFILHQEVSMLPL